MTTTESTMRAGGWTPEFDSVCLSAEQFTIASRRMIREAAQVSRDLEVRSELEGIVDTLDYVAGLLGVGDVEAAVWCAQDVALAWQQFAVARVDADSVTDVDVMRWSRVSNALIEIEHRARYAMRVWIARGR